MYLARKTKKGKIAYILRQSYQDERVYRHRDLFELGADPTIYIRYPGGNAYYIDDRIREELDHLGVRVGEDELEELFWPFVKPSIRRAVENFRRRSVSGIGRRGLSAEETETIRRAIHPFDKRRWHYLKFGNMDQGPLMRMPPVLFKQLLGKSRDEIEQLFLSAERVLEETEWKSYVYVAFDLQRFFSGFLAKKMPHVLDQARIDDHFIAEICHLNRILFDGSATVEKGLHTYLIRYASMFFDHEFAHSPLLDEMVQDFIYRHHFHRPPTPEPTVDLDAAVGIFGIRAADLPTMTRKGLMRRYRRMAHQFHPDKGGSAEKFVLLQEAYQRLLQHISSKTKKNHPNQ